MWSIDVELIEHWVSELDYDSRAQLFAALELLQQHGPRLTDRW
ncbi:hypothetical protein [Rothia nasisuis]|nr:hypothetical protein [Rothia nasisuis]